MKIGIITLYYDNTNYGGLLQAYALQSFLQMQGHSTEQICWDFHKAISEHSECRLIRTSTINTCVSTKQSLVTRITKKAISCLLKNRFSQREMAFKKFELEIPHSKKVVTPSNFLEVVGSYDCIIVGSDQIWNMNWYCPEHFLENCNDVIRIAYAASMPDINLTEVQIDTLRTQLSLFRSISVRERDTVDFLNDIVLGDNAVRWMPDPTLLLTKEHWGEICEPVKMSCKPFIFCYFLGKGNEVRRKAQIISKEMGIRLIMLPHLNDIVEADIYAPGDKLYDINPKQFLWLIKNASYVLTDSFHATVFSIIFQTRFLTFGRDGNDEKNSRIKTLLNIFDLDDHLCSVNAEFKQMDLIMRKNISDQEKILKKLRIDAKTFINYSLNI